MERFKDLEHNSIRNISNILCLKKHFIFVIKRVKATSLYFSLIHSILSSYTISHFSYFNRMMQYINQGSDLVIFEQVKFQSARPTWFFRYPFPLPLALPPFVIRLLSGPHDFSISFGGRKRERVYDFHVWELNYLGSFVCKQIPFFSSNTHQHISTRSKNHCKAFG